MKLNNSKLNFNKKSKIIGYKQEITYFNDTPKDLDQIIELTNISTCRYNPNRKNTKTLEEMLSRPKNYFFTVTSKLKDQKQYIYNNYIYSDKNVAIKEHKKLKLKLYDTLIYPYISKINNNKKLSLEDKDNIIKILENFNNLKNIS